MRYKLSVMKPKLTWETDSLISRINILSAQIPDETGARDLGPGREMLSYLDSKLNVK